MDRRSAVDNHTAPIVTLCCDAALLRVLSLYVHLLTDQVVFRLANIHPVAWHGMLVKLLVLSHLWENHSFD